METKKCLYCNEEIIGKRDDAKFCSNTCKAKHWEEKKTEQPAKEEKSVTSQLRGVVNGTDTTNPINAGATPTTKTVEVQIINPTRLPIEQDKKKVIDIKRQLGKEIQQLEMEIKQIGFRNGGSWIIGLTGAGIFAGDKIAETKAPNDNGGKFIGGILGFITGVIVQDVTKSSREADKKKRIQELQQYIYDKQTLLKNADKTLIVLDNRLKEIPAYQTVQKQISVTTPTSKENKPFLLNNISSYSLTGLKTDVSDVCLTDINSDKIISSQHLKKMEFKALNFQGKWQNLFGLPSINFHCVLHGMSGEGKSTFAIQFAKYLADNFGRVIYISGEEGFSKTFKDKFSNNNAESKFLDVADLRTFEDINREVPQEAYNFIFIDSLDTMKIDADKMKKIRELYKNSALITISQSTKDGKMRGSYEIVHDCDIAVKVENGIATTTKNRFKEKGMTLNVFEDKNNTPVKKNRDSFLL